MNLNVMNLQKSMGLMGLMALAAASGGEMYSPISRERATFKRKINAGKKRPFKGSKAAKKASRKK